MRVTGRATFKEVRTILGERGFGASRDIQRFATGAVIRYSTPYVPIRSSPLRKSARNEVFQAIWDSPYAHYQFRGKLMVDPETRSPYARRGVAKVLTNTDLTYSGGGKVGPEWTERMKADRMDDIVREIRERAGLKNGNR